MGVFDKAEKKIESAVGKVFARAFKGDVQPVEIAAGIQRELDAEARLLTKGKRLVPNQFGIGLSSHDYDRLYPYAKTLTAEILPGIREHAAERQYIFNGPISITYYCDQTLPTGQFTVASEATDVDEPSRLPAQAARQMVLEVNGVRHLLTPPGLLIGRGSNADLRLDDPGISRRHAMILVAADGTVTIEDLGSTNGVHVNGVRISKTALNEGSRIELGSTRLLVHTPSES